MSLTSKILTKHEKWVKDKSLYGCERNLCACYSNTEQHKTDVRMRVYLREKERKWGGPFYLHMHKHSFTFDISDGFFSLIKMIRISSRWNLLLNYFDMHNGKENWIFFRLLLLLLWWKTISRREQVFFVEKEKESNFSFLSISSFSFCSIFYLSFIMTTNTLKISTCPLNGKNALLLGIQLIDFFADIC